MVRTVAAGLAGLLAAIAALHVYWGLGGFWPGQDSDSLVDMVMGMPPGTPIPPLWACAIVAVCLVLPAVAALIVAGVLPTPLGRVGRWLSLATLGGAAAVLVLRGLSTYLSPLVESARGTAFYELDRVIYAPLCLALGAVLILVLVLRPRNRRRSILPGSR
jgi:hypothetical protein